MRYTKIRIRTAVIAGLAALTLAGCGSAASSSSSASQASSPSSSAAAAPSVSYTAAQLKFITGMFTEYGIGNATTAASEANVVTIGSAVCSGFQSGGSASTIATEIQQSLAVPAGYAPGVVTLAGRDLCPQQLVQANAVAAKAAAANAKAAAKAAAAQAAAAKAAAAKAAAARAAKVAAEDTPISAAQWGRVTRNPANYVGDIYTISGTVAEYNINSNTFATNANAALVATDSDGNDFVVEGDSSLLGNVQPGDTFTAKVTVEGVDQSQNTVSGGTGEIPDFLASTFTVTG